MGRENVTTLDEKVDLAVHLRDLAVADVPMLANALEGVSFGNESAFREVLSALLGHDGEDEDGNTHELTAEENEANLASMVAVALFYMVTLRARVVRAERKVAELESMRGAQVPGS